MKDAIKRQNPGFVSYVLIAVFAMAALSVPAGCTPALSIPSQTSVPTTNQETTATTPTIKVIQPVANSVQIDPDVTIVVEVSGFNIANHIGKPNTAGEGHLVYFLDVDAPTTAGQPVMTAPGTFAMKQQYFLHMAEPA